MITAINKKYQGAVNRAYKHYRKYHELVNAESCEDKQSAAFDKYEDILGDLPKRERDNFDR